MRISQFHIFSSLSLHFQVDNQKTRQKEINMPTSPAGNNSETEKDIWSSLPKQFLCLVTLLVTILGILLQVKYQNQESSPFDTNKRIMESFVVVTYLYAGTIFASQIIIARVERGASCRKIFGHLSFFCGALASILLVLLVVPPFGWILVTLWVVSAFAWFLQIGFPFVRMMCSELDYKTLWVKFSSLSLHFQVDNQKTRQKEINMPTSPAGNNSETEKDIWSSLPKQFLCLVTLLVTILGILLQVKYQNQESSPFDTNKRIMESFVVVTYLYAGTIFASQIIIARVERGASCRKIFGHLSFFCGALASILLVLLVVPPFGWILVTLWVVSAFAWFLQIGFPFVRMMCSELDYKTLWVKFSSLSLHFQVDNQKTRQKEINMPTSPAGNNSETEKDIWSSLPKQFLCLVTLLVTILGILLQVKYQNQESSPFDTNKRIMESFVVVTYLYAGTIFASQIIIARVERGASCRKIFGHLSFFCGALASILLVLLVVPPFGWILVTLWVVSAFAWFLQIGFPFVRMMCSELDYKTLWVKFSNIVCCNGHHSGDQQQQLPV